MCDIPLPPQCSLWAPSQVFSEHVTAHCKSAQSRYIVTCAGGLGSYYSAFLGIVASFLGVQLLVLLCVLVYLRRVRQRAMMESQSAGENDMETLAERVKIEQAQLAQQDKHFQNRKPGHYLVLPAYYWFLRLEGLLCSLWILYYGLCIWLEVDPTERGY